MNFDPGGEVGCGVCVGGSVGMLVGVGVAVGRLQETRGGLKIKVNKGTENSWWTSQTLPPRSVGMSQTALCKLFASQCPSCCKINDVTSWTDVTGPE